MPPTARTHAPCARTWLLQHGGRLPGPPRQQCQGWAGDRRIATVSLQVLSQGSGLLKSTGALLVGHEGGKGCRHLQHWQVG